MKNLSMAASKWSKEKFSQIKEPILGYLNLDYLNPRLSKLTKACKIS